MLLVMAVSLFTVRVVLRTLGEVDYGLYNVIGGIVAMFAFLSNTMASASQRFFSYELGKKQFGRLRQTFSITVIIYIIIAVIILIVAETLGIWFLNTKMTIPVERLSAANWVFQFSVISFIITILTIPYNAAIIAQENMKIYAYVSIVEVLLKLGIVYILLLFSCDKLKLYSLLMLITTIIVSVLYISYCRYKYKEYRFCFVWDKGIFKSLIGYSGWSLFGSLSGVMKNYGVNVVLNVFFEPVVNASRAIAYQVGNAINQFSMNFLTATNPQIIKYYAEGEKKKMLWLVFQSSKLSFFLLYLLALPLIIEIDKVLSLWLDRVPSFAVIFTVLVIIDTLINSLSLPLMTAAQATGRIKWYQIIIGGTQLLNLPISYLFLLRGAPPQSTMYVAIAISILCLFLRLFILESLLKLSFNDYIINVLFRVLLVIIFAGLPPYAIHISMEESFMRLILVVICSCFSSSIAILFLGFNKNERINIVDKMKAMLFKVKKNDFISSSITDKYSGPTSI